MLRPRLLHVMLLITITPIVMGCACMGKTDPSEFRPTDYSNFVYTAFNTYWKVMDDEVVDSVDPSKWVLFSQAMVELKKYGIDFEKEFIDRMLKRDKLWESYEANRKIYENENPGKTYKDQLVYFISETWKVIHQ